MYICGTGPDSGRGVRKGPMGCCEGACEEGKCKCFSEIYFEAKSRGLYTFWFSIYILSIYLLLALALPRLDYPGSQCGDKFFHARSLSH